MGDDPTLDDMLVLSPCFSRSCSHSISILIIITGSTVFISWAPRLMTISNAVFNSIGRYIDLEICFEDDVAGQD
jgi:hypothetical protein